MDHSGVLHAHKDVLALGKEGAIAVPGEFDPFIAQMSPESRANGNSGHAWEKGLGHLHDWRSIVGNSLVHMTEPVHDWLL